jgi:acyl-[acyl-carrier-protein]-phospholipid O-acyltransferase/long-chain-fatty-acid--[acyl-carrier-protein] ligase
MRYEFKHPLRGLLIAQFFGALNDNAWKLIVALLAIRHVATAVGPSGAAFEAASQSFTTRAFVIFTIPFLLCSLPAGVLADRLSKRSVIIGMKAVEVLLLVAGTLILFMNPMDKVWLLVILGLMGVHSAIFSPAKYGILPELLPHDRLSAGNGLLELWSFLAIIIGTVLGGVLLGIVGEATWMAGLILASLAVVALLASWTVPRVPPARLEGGIRETVKAAWIAVQNDRVLKLTIAGLVFFWFIASAVGQNILVYAKAVLHLSDTLSGLPLAIFAIGTGLGAILAGKLSASKVELGLIPAGAIGLASLLLLFGILSPGTLGTFLLMAFLGLASGLLIVPLNSLLQWRAPADRRGAVIAVSNTFVFAGILAGSLGVNLFSHAGLTTSGILFAAGLVTAVGTVWALWLLPVAFVRLILVMLTHTIYRLRIVGPEHIPEKGPALLVANHVSFIDWLLLMASIDRPIHFIVEAQYFQHPLLKPFMNLVGAIPISTSEGPRILLRALRDAAHYLDEGKLVCIFPEGQITRTGALLPFQRGFARILKGRNVPIIPVHLDNLWGSIFSYSGGRFIWKMPPRIPYPVTVSFGPPLPPNTTPQEARQAVQELSEVSWRSRKAHRRPLHHSFVRSMRRHPFRLVFADSSRPHVSGLQALAGAIMLARKLCAFWRSQQIVGILLPPSVAGALVNFAATLAGRVTVNLNYTAGRTGMQSAATQAELRTVVTSRTFLEKAKLELPVGLDILYLEDLQGSVGATTRISALMLAIFAPIRLLEWASGAPKPSSVEDLATIIFSSGSTGEPKGVMLSHYNIDANVQAASQVMGLSASDRILGILPFFHSFGYTATLWLASIQGMAVIFHPSPLDTTAIGQLVQRYQVTFLIATPTFLQLYLRRCTPDQLGSLRAVLTGAEKLSDRLAEAFEERFGIRPFEGYGTTECAPVIAVNVQSVRKSGIYQAGVRRGSVGQPLPGIAVRIVNPESFESLPVGQPGLLLVKGPNVMQGYLGKDDLTAKVLRDGWYVTGDIAVLDEDGFLWITDRLSRFSKIGGEMVPHGRVEEVLHQMAKSEVQVFAVTAIPDERKGEQLAVLHTLDEARLPEILDAVAAFGLPNLFIPRRDHFIKVEKLPVLGTGKLDLREIKRMAMEKLSDSISSGATTIKPDSSLST